MKFKDKLSMPSSFLEGGATLESAPHSTSAANDLENCIPKVNIPQHCGGRRATEAMTGE